MGKERSTGSLAASQTPLCHYSSWRCGEVNAVLLTSHSKLQWAEHFQCQSINDGGMYQRYLHHHIYHSTVYNMQNTESTKVCILRGMDKENVTRIQMQAHTHTEGNTL